MNTDIKTYNQTIDAVLNDGKRKGIIIAIDALRNKSFQEMFSLEKLEAEICAEALFTHINELIK